ncbi:iron-sulfur cluster assembly scaffold protein [Mycoplasma sp. HU2014]|uniref:iron-sulfur cluster assembly scaffold protein n=1 Tax=Mycoplasma sp. HU2014 TaxID=1664275 RepID=UPI00067DC6FF|nr:iron-sulfur cluster assembly scaffold protein [Mycoplasma sp. HU2014]KNG79508.1 NifU-like protein [Mycoplasma sp. HU2014]
MIDINNDSLLRQILMKHFTNSDNKTLLDNPNAITKLLKSNTCADQLTIQVLIVSNIIKSIRFEGSACVVATSSTDILINQIKDKTITESLNIIYKYKDLINNGDLTNIKDLNELVVFKNIYKQKNRILCASLPINGLIEILKDYE